jgi:hypothetical protein
VQTNLALIRVWRHKIIYSCWRQNFKKGLLSMRKADFLGKNEQLKDLS